MILEGCSLTIYKRANSCLGWRFWPGQVKKERCLGSCPQAVQGAPGGSLQNHHLCRSGLFSDTAVFDSSLLLSIPLLVIPIKSHRFAKLDIGLIITLACYMFPLWGEQMCVQENDRTELTLANWPLTSIYDPWHIHTYIHTLHTYTHIQTYTK